MYNPSPSRMKFVHERALSKAWLSSGAALPPPVPLSRVQTVAPLRKGSVPGHVACWSHDASHTRSVRMMRRGG